MTKANSVFKAIMDMPLKKKIIVIFLSLVTLFIICMIPVYAWFTNQKKAAEMYKVEYPNSLYINAAHREDQIYFDLGEINMGDYRRNALGQWLDANGDVVEKKEDADKIDKKRYVFSVSGSNTGQYILQLAHTTNNEFTYTIYKASQYYYAKGTTAGTITDEQGNEVTIKASDIVPSGTADADIIPYKLHPNSHTENPLTIIGTDIIGEEPGDTVYFVKEIVLPGAYKNDTNSDGKGDLNTGDTKYYKPDYGTNNNVHGDAVAMYWQGTSNPEWDSNKKFCDYYILEVTWNNRSDSVINKETDMVYLSVKRTG